MTPHAVPATPLPRVPKGRRFNTLVDTLERECVRLGYTLPNGVAADMVEYKIQTTAVVTQTSVETMLREHFDQEWALTFAATITQDNDEHAANDPRLGMRSVELPVSTVGTILTGLASTGLLIGENITHAGIPGDLMHDLSLAQRGLGEALSTPSDSGTVIVMHGRLVTARVLLDFAVTNLDDGTWVPCRCEDSGVHTNNTTQVGMDQINLARKHLARAHIN